MARPEVTGAKPYEADEVAEAPTTRKPPPPPVPKLALSIPEFCVSVGISQAYYFELKKLGLTPREMELGARRIITLEEAQRWCRERTAAAPAT